MSSYIFILKHRDYNVATLNIDDDGELLGGRIIDVNRVPFGQTDDERQLALWWKNRAIPEGREQLAGLLRAYGCDNPQELLLKNLALSLTDNYWICPLSAKDLSFNQVNLFDHGNETLVFHDGEGRAHYSNSPNAALGGSLEKTAEKKDGEWYVVKRCNSRYPDGQQNVNEMYAAKIHQLQGWTEYTPYSVMRNNAGICEQSVCKYFTSKDIELLHANDITTTAGTLQYITNYDGEKELERYVQLCTLGGLEREYVMMSLDYMILTDFIISNSDRHWENFGVLRDPESLKYISLAPLYDHGNSMFYDSVHEMTRMGLIKMKNTGILEQEIQRLSLVHDKAIVKADLLPSPAEVADFYEENGIREDRAKVIAKNYSLKLDLFLEYQHGLQVSVSHEMENLGLSPFVEQKPNPAFFAAHPDELPCDVTIGHGTFTLICGMPLSGKTQQAKRMAAENPNAVIVSLADVKEAFGEEIGYEIAQERICRNIANGKDVIYDAVNLHKETRDDMLNAVINAGSWHNTLIYMCTEYNEIRKRAKAVGFDLVELEDMNKNFADNLPIHGHDRWDNYREIHGEIFDISNTLEKNGRSDYDRDDR